MNAHQSAQHDTLLHCLFGRNQKYWHEKKKKLKCKEDEEGAAAQVHVGSGNILGSQKIKKKRDKEREKRTESRLYEKNQTHLECRRYGFAFLNHASFI